MTSKQIFCALLSVNCTLLMVPTQCKKHTRDMSKGYFIALFMFLSIFQSGYAQKADSIKTQMLDEVVVKENVKQRQSRSTTPLQILDGKQLKQSGALLVSDAVKFLSGVNVKDYGGIGGLKTVSVRSLGTNHTAVAYDGITLTDTQTGQIDLGKLSLDNVNQISLSIGQDDNILQPARQFASANILNIKSSTPTFENKSYNGSFSLKGGSFGLLNPSIFIANKWNNKLSSSANIDYMRADGAYPYTQKNGDETQRMKRVNSDIQTLKTELNLYSKCNVGKEASLKAYYFFSERGLPSNKLYNPRANERLKDQNVFIQGYYKKEYNKQWSILANAKYNFSYNKYSCPDEAVYNAPTENNYYQREYYVSATAMFRPTESLSFALANDVFVNNMNADLRDFAYPTRITALNALAGKYVTNRFTATANLVLTNTKEWVKAGLPADNQKQLSPSASISYQLLPNENLRMRMLYKKTFRLPTFNDLYYAQMGTRDLKPEDIKEYNIGLSWTKKLDCALSSFSISCDGFYNEISNKIIAVPTLNLFIWTMRNIGKVNIKGLETNASATFKITNKISLNSELNYAYQQAIDKTDKYTMPYRMTYNHQLPYTPSHSGSARWALSTPWINLSYAIIASGSRFSSPNNLPEYKMAGYTDHTLSAWYNLKIKNIKLNIQGDILNLFNNEYEVIQNYPMPGRQFRATIKLFI